jgi:hypothetical protein
MHADWPYLKWRMSKVRRRLIRAACSRLYRDVDRDPARSILVSGTGRSGTTWLADVIASQVPCRTMFEPFHSRQVEAFRQFHYFQYARPSDSNEELRAYCHRVLTGAIRDKWIDCQVEHLFARYRVIKAIRANLFLKWMHDRFPEVKLLFIVRHPCAVVLSRLQLGWATDTDIQPFLAQRDLVEDCLASRMDMVERAETPEEKHAIIWCISNLVPLSQFGADDFNVVFYEHLCTQPEIEVPRIFRAVSLPYRDDVFRRVVRPSTTTVRTSAIVTGEDKVTRWKGAFSCEQIDSILSIVRGFGLDHIYGESTMPSAEQVSRTADAGCPEL